VGSIKKLIPNAAKPTAIGPNTSNFKFSATVSNKSSRLISSSSPEGAVTEALPDIDCGSFIAARP
jgi:hypothetical protein